LVKFYSLLVLSFLFIGRSAGQTNNDSLPRTDSLPRNDRAADSSKPVKIKKIVSHPKRDTLLKKDNIQKAMVKTDSVQVPVQKTYRRGGGFGFEELLAGNPWFNFRGRPVRPVSTLYHPKSFEGLFYALMTLLFFFATVKLLFGRYMANLLTLFFRVSMRQQQIREQVLQSPLPSLLLNIFFILSAGLYGAFLILYYHPDAMDHLWLIFGYLLISLSTVYLVKFLFLKLAGWIFNLKRASDTYIFVIFLTNKIVGIFLLPFIVILSFSGPLVSIIAVTGSEVLVITCLVYRIFAAYGTLRAEIKISVIHYFLYLCAFEIAPLLLIYKVLLSYLEKAY
jgi:Domain of unknown function (DUF4271)